MHGRLVWMLTVMPFLVAESRTVFVDPPGPVVTTPGRNFTFNCLLVMATSDKFQSVTWFLNESALETLGSDNVITQFSSIGSGAGFMTLINFGLEYNHTAIKCRGSLQSGRILTSEGVLLLVQGTLAAVSDLNLTTQNSTVSLTWMAPFTLNIGSNTTYNVTVVVVNTELNVTYMISMTTFQFHLPPGGIGCDNVVFTVIPLNEVGEGTPTSVILSQSVTSPQLIEAPSFEAEEVSTKVVIYHLSMSSPVCSAEVTLTDNITGEIITLRDMDLNISSTWTHTEVTFTNERLVLNRQYRFTVTASNINGSTTFSGDISTYDVVYSGVHTNPLRIYTTYLPNSNAAGVLYGFFYDGGSGIDFSRSAYLALSRNDSLSYEFLSPLPAGIYHVHTYVIEQNGLLSSGITFPATTEVFSVEGDPQFPVNLSSSSEINDCGTSISGLAVSVLCSYTLASSSTGFMLVVQEKSVNGARRLLVNATEQGEPQGPVTVQLTESKAYQVTVFPIREGMGILESNVAYTVEIVLDVVGARWVSVGTSTPTVFPVNVTPSSVLDMLPIILGVSVGIGVLALLAVILVVVVCHISSRSMRLNTPSEIISEEKTESHVGLSSRVETIDLTVRGSLIYEEIDDAKSSFTYTQNILYGHSTTRVTHGLTSDPVPEVPTGIDPSKLHDKDHNYEPVEYQSIDNAYKVQQCSAYGVASSVGVSCDLERSQDPSRPCKPSRSCDRGMLHGPNELHHPKKPRNLCDHHVSCGLDCPCNLDGPCDPGRQEDNEWHRVESHDINNPCNPDREENVSPSHSGVTVEPNDLADLDEEGSGVTATLRELCLTDSCACVPDPQENYHAPGRASEKACDLDNPDQAENSGVASSSEEQCDLEDCPAYGVPQLAIITLKN